MQESAISRNEKFLRIFSAIVAALLFAGETARWWGNPRFIPLAFDELLLAAILIGGARSRRFGTLPLAIGWAALAGHTLGQLVPTLDHLLAGPPKDSANFYAVILTIMLAVEIAALSCSVKLAHRLRIAGK